MDEIVFFAAGTPAPQGSKRHVGGGRLVESSRQVGPWRATARRAALEAMSGQQPRTGPLEVYLRFIMPRPEGHLRQGRAQTDGWRLLPSAPRQHTGKPDVDKLVRAILDALTGVCWCDDAQVVAVHAEKTYAYRATPTPGVHAIIRTAATPLCVGCGRNAYSYRQTADGPLCVDCALGDELADEDEEP
ncbi:RusA family crossover junction endodeoxyribonuclease [Actinomyces naeslundii]